MIETHLIRPPMWIMMLIRAAHGAMQSGVPLNLGYRFQSMHEETQLIVFPLPSTVDGGRDDGLRLSPFFEFDVLRIAEEFNSLNELSMRSTSEYNLEGSEFRISGLFQNRPVLLRVLSDPPPSAPSHTSVDGITGEVQLRKTK